VKVGIELTQGLATPWDLLRLIERRNTELTRLQMDLDFEDYRWLCFPHRSRIFTEAAEIRKQTAAQLPPPWSLSRSQAKKRLAILAERLNTTPKDLVSRLPPGVTLCDGGLESLEYQAKPIWKKVFADIVETFSLTGLTVM
jgi:hypothetical protein